MGHHNGAPGSVKVVVGHGGGHWMVKIVGAFNEDGSGERLR